MTTVSVSHKAEMDNLVVHHLANGATVIPLSGHEFRFSDGTVSPAQSPEWVERFNLERKFTVKTQIMGMVVNELEMVFSDDQLAHLKEISNKADLVILPFPILDALRRKGVREEFPNCVSFNATKETMREPPANKVVDINNWSY